MDSNKLNYVIPITHSTLDEKYRISKIIDNFYNYVKCITFTQQYNLTQSELDYIIYLIVANINKVFIETENIKNISLGEFWIESALIYHDIFVNYSKNIMLAKKFDLSNLIDKINIKINLDITDNF